MQDTTAGQHITSRGYELPDTAQGMEQERVWFNMWSLRLWPYNEVVAGDTLYWYETAPKRVVWQTRITEVLRFIYADKAEAAHKLTEAYGHVDTTQPYFQLAKPSGYGLAWRCRDCQRLDIPKPHHLTFPQTGWMHRSKADSAGWHLPPPTTGPATLDDITTEGSILDRLAKLNEAMQDVAPERIRAVVTQTLRHDADIVQALKEAADHRCQFPNCGIRIPKKNGGYYVEVAHILPTSKGGLSILGNLLVLCPNHHKEFDHGTLTITTQTPTHLTGTLNGTNFDMTVS
jgi:HNH endonuclease